MRRTRILPLFHPLTAALCAFLIASCSRHGGPSSVGAAWDTDGSGAELSGRGFVHYHPYPDTGQCYCGIEYDFTANGKMIAAASESIHHHFKDKLCENRKFAWITSRSTGAKVRVMIVDKGGQPTDDFNRSEQHIMDLSLEAFKVLDPDGEGVRTGRIDVDWAITPAD